MVDSLITELRKVYNYISRNQVLTEENIKINLIREVFLKEMGFDLLACTYERDSKGKRSDISISINQSKEIFFIETKRGDVDLSYSDVNQILDYIKAPGMEWGLITNGREFILVNAKIDTPTDTNNEAYKHNIVFWFDIFELRKRDRTDIKYFKFLEYERMFVTRTTIFFKDIVQFKAIAFPNNFRSWATYKSTLYQFFDFYSGKRISKYRNGILEEISLEDFKSFMEFKKNRENGLKSITSSQSIANNYSHISSMLNTLKDNGKIARTLFDKGRSYGLEEFEITENRKNNNYLTSENVRRIINFYIEKRHAERDICVFLLCSTLGLERPNIINLTWYDVKLDVSKPFLKVDKRELELSTLLTSCFKFIREEHNKEKIKGTFVFNTYYNGKYRPFSESTVNAVFNKLVEINEEGKWECFSPQYVRSCMVEVMFDNGYSIDEIIYSIGIDLKNIYRYISTNEIIERRKNNPRGIKIKSLFDGLLDKTLADFREKISF